MPLERESDLYEPLKAYLERQGYAVKGEVGACDLVARRGEEEPVVVEMKRRFNLDLVLQGVERQTLSERVYLAVPAAEARGATLKRRYKAVLKLCRMLGLGLLVVDPGRKGPAQVEARLDPGPYRPRGNPRRQGRLLREFDRRVGDPNAGGSQGRGRGIVTAYRQDALRCALLIGREGPTKVAIIRERTAVARAAGILQRDVYGWFERVERGVYGLSPKGEAALETYADIISLLEAEAAA